MVVCSHSGGDDRAAIDSEAGTSYMLSQSSQAAAAVPTISGQSALFADTLGFLRRAMTQAREVREALYDGVFDVFASHPQLQLFVFELLLPQFERFVDLSSSDKKLDIKLVECVTRFTPSVLLFLTVIVLCC